MEKRLKLKDTIRQLLDSREVAVLATQGPEYPHACLVAFTATEDLRHLYFVTRRSTRKFENMDHDNRVMLLVDNRSNSEKDFDNATVITGRGKAVPVSCDAALEILPFYLKRHPYLEAFARHESSVLVRVEIESYAVVTRFQNLTVLEMEPGAILP
jgi:nitroimidazol reductase NimA-like FMN-containing flavoprotein (pyridoxamine 5'-phosphate oxidase superfamily)